MNKVTNPMRAPTQTLRSLKLAHERQDGRQLAQGQERDRGQVRERDPELASVRVLARDPGLHQVHDHVQVLERHGDLGQALLWFQDSRQPEFCALVSTSTRVGVLWCTHFSPNLSFYILSNLVGLAFATFDVQHS